LLNSFQMVHPRLYLAISSSSFHSNGVCVFSCCRCFGWPVCML
jgi:hypothetical protein